MDEGSESFKISPLVSTTSHRPRSWQNIQSYAQPSQMPAHFLELMMAIPLTQRLKSETDVLYHGIGGFHRVLVVKGESRLSKGLADVA